MPTLEAKTYSETIYYLIRRKIAAVVLLKGETQKTMIFKIKDDNNTGKEGQSEERSLK